MVAVGSLGLLSKYLLSWSGGVFAFVTEGGILSLVCIFGNRFLAGCWVTEVLFLTPFSCTAGYCRQFQKPNFRF